MKQIFRLWFVYGFCVLFIFTGCNRLNIPLSTSGGAPAAASVETPPQADNSLSANLYNFYQSQSGNILFSPFSIITALAMVQEGAGGQTASQMQSVLNLSPDPTVRQPAFQQLISEINAPGKHYTLSTANNLWIQQGFTVLPAYLNTVETDYFAGVTNLDFIGNPSGSLQTINGAVSIGTDGFIPNLLSPTNINPGIKLILTNAIYFKGTWDTQFPVTATNSQNFNLTSTASETVSMMHETLTGIVGNFNGAASVVAIPYQDKEASMFVFLPPPGGMAALESQMTGTNINAFLNSYGKNGSGALVVNTPIILSLPKFTFSTSYNLTQTLQQMGMTLAFSTGADFSGIDGNKDLFISYVVHKAYVSVDETGTTAAGATGVGLQIMAIGLSVPPVTFTVDRPFIFMIVENTTNTVLFMGRVNDPLAAN